MEIKIRQSKARPIKTERTGTRRSGRRTDALSKERIVEAAIDILDAEGENALTFRALAARLSTGSGAIYWHVADKNELLTAATDAIIGGVLTGLAPDATPDQAIRAFALGLFDAIDAHPWVGTHLFREPWQAAMLEIFEAIGGRLQALGVPEEALFNAGSALVNYILGVAGQNAANARLQPQGTDRSAVLGAIAASWTERDPARYPFVHHLATKLRDHDDREQFLAGIDLILAGIGAIKGANEPGR
ncbi:TetR/AcrR family transcriptional regulator [Rhizobium sp. WYJ-E13]|uniref:TetR/AcrR family transcriptional regulator n=1 Tax=Rhizobium sp. WYJ-E13 TaxID=2849093 RepID=UPI001C1EB18D|nr:TetR/AcrR family transcriptional regulator [Rhizobium sp. WYJ-E13]QWW70024.1 TetR family transcriptional regulator [Rhizobium sp. WYJ-E13]